MIYTPKNTAGRQRPVKIFLNGSEVNQPIYLDRRRRIIKTFAEPITLEDGKVKRKVIRYHHRDRLVVLEVSTGRILGRVLLPSAEGDH